MLGVLDLELSGCNELGSLRLSAFGAFFTQRIIFRKSIKAVPFGERHSQETQRAEIAEPTLAFPRKLLLLSESLLHLVSHVLE